MMTHLNKRNRMMDERPSRMNSLMKIWLISVVALPAAMGDTLALLAGEGAATPGQQRKHLLLDDRVIERTENARLVLGEVRKHPRNPLFGEDKPWEPRYDNMYPNVIYDEEEKTYKCWYTPFITSKLDEETPRDKRKDVKWNVSERRPGLCYAVSKDGLAWEKPELGLVDFRGSKRNNIVAMDIMSPGIVKDLREKDPERRYKMFGSKDGLKPYRVWFSPDGLHWGESTVLDIGSAKPDEDGYPDTHNNFFWNATRQEWVTISRIWTAWRTVARTSSRDFVNWQPVEMVLESRNVHDDLHDMVAVPYEGIYVGLIGVFDRVADRQWVELAWSPDTIQWHRVLPGTRLIPNGAKKGDYDWGCIFACQPFVRGNEIFIYYAGCNNNFFDWRDGFLCLATIGKDRWAGYRTEGEQPGTIVTNPVLCRGKDLAITADAKGGSICVTVSIENGDEVIHSESITGDVTDQIIANLTPFVGKSVRLSFELKQATLYSFSFLGSERGQTRPGQPDASVSR